MSCSAETGLLRPEAHAALAEAFLRYPPAYDDVLSQVGVRLVVHGAATKLDLAALIAWKHVQTATWMRELLELPDSEVREATAGAFEPGLSDQDRVRAIEPLRHGFGAGGAFTSVLFAAWAPDKFGVYDRRIEDNRSRVIVPACTCVWEDDLPHYWDHLRRIAREMSTNNGQWTPRMVDMAMFKF